MAAPKKNLSPNFTYASMIRSNTADSLKISNVPDAAALKNLTDLCKNILEPIRKAVGNEPIVVSSGYRSPKVNVAVGGVTTSAHCYGLAADITCPRFGEPKALAIFIADFLKKNKIPFDQVIYEHVGNSKWVHVGIRHPNGKQRGQVLTIKGHTTSVGIV
jgi:hypothetical protein